MRLNNHHILYNPEWTVELPQHFHNSISIIQRTIPTPERYMLLNNCDLALQWERIRYHCYLDTGQDLNKMFGKIKEF